MVETIGFIGLGKLGLPMAENLLASGFPMRVYNRTADKAAGMVAGGAALMGSAAEAAVAGGVVLTVVSDDKALLAVADDAFCEALGAGVHVSMSTVSPETSRMLAERHARFGGQLVAAPVFGRPPAAKARKLWICTSGPADAKARLKPVFDALGQGVFDFGEEPGAANVVKLAGNFLLTAAIEAMGEASAMAEKNGVPRAALLNMFTSTLFNCPIYVNYSKPIIESEFGSADPALAGFSNLLILKDMQLVQKTASTGRAPMPMVNLLVDRYLALIANGKENFDAVSLVLGAAGEAGLNWEKPE